MRICMADQLKIALTVLTFEGIEKALILAVTHHPFFYKLILLEYKLLHKKWHDQQSIIQIHLIKVAIINMFIITI